MSTHVAVVGAYGSAGAAVADRLAEAPDVEVTLVDDGDPGGGLCILRGCMPSKEVLSAAEHRFSAREDPRLAGPAPAVDLERVVERKNDHTENWAAHRRAAIERLADRANVEFLARTARFVDDRSIAVGDRVLDPDYVVIATGSTPALPDLPGVAEVPLRTSADVLDGTAFGDSGIVMGFGYVALELVPYLAEAAKMDLTVIEHDARPLDEADPAFGDTLRSYYREAFDVTILTETTERRLEATEEGVCAHLASDGEERIIEADQLFAFTGRRPALDALALENTTLEPGAGWVTDTMQTRADERVFVVGDANGREPLLHVAKQEAGIAAENILSHREGTALSAHDNLHHHVIFSGLGVLPYARVGHSATSAASAGRETVTVTREASSDGVFATKNADDGLARLVVATDGTVLGWQGLHYHADVMAKTMQVVVELGLDVRDLPDRAYHPTTPELLDGLIREAIRELEP
jgi:dihydrolipoamide dehydrogenase